MSASDLKQIAESHEISNTVIIDMQTRFQPPTVFMDGGSTGTGRHGTTAAWSILAV